jgi:hypothetical protein
MEALQMLKFMLKSKRVHFMDGWRADPAEMEVEVEDSHSVLEAMLGTPTGDLEALCEKAGLFDEESLFSYNSNDMASPDDPGRLRF